MTSKPEVEAQIANLRVQRQGIVEELQQIHVQLADKNRTDGRGRRLASDEYWKQRQRLITRATKLQRDVARVNQQLHELHQEPSLREKKDPQVIRLVRRMIAIVERVGAERLTDAEADILDEASNFVLEQELEDQ